MMQTVNERLRDESIAHAVWISRYSTGVAARMVKILNDSDAELTARLLVALDSLDPGSFTVTRLESLLASVREVTNMKLKTVEINGKQYAEIDTAGLPVYVHDDGKEIGFDAPLAIKKITELNGEAKNHRLAKEAAEEKLAKFAAIEDPKKAIEALEMLSKIDQKKLIDAGQVDQVKAEITKNFQQQLDEEKQRSQMLETQLYDSMIGGSFAGSKYIADKIAIPADLLQARFGQAFKVEEGKIVAYDASGNKIYSRAKPGELAQFDEALEFLVENYPQKDYILKASGNNGGGSRPTQHDIGQKTMKRSAFDALDVAGKQNALKSGGHRTVSGAVVISTTG